jgi:hypothetical protein
MAILHTYALALTHTHTQNSHTIVVMSFQYLMEDYVSLPGAQ